jgi:hypothetical protein
MADNASQQQAKVLRIGIVQGGKIVQERLIKPGQPVTIGESAKNTFPLPPEAVPPGLPKRFPLFVPAGDGYQISFTDQVGGRLAIDEEVQDLAVLKDRPDAQKKGDAWMVPLNEKSRGKVQLGNVTVLFQFVAAPPESARVAERGDFRPKLFDEDDTPFIGFLALWSAIAAVFLVYANHVGPTQQVSMAEIPDRFAEILLAPKSDVEPPPPLETDEPTTDPNMAAEKAKKEEAKKPEEKLPKASNDKERAENAALAREQKREQVMAQSALLAMIGTRGASGKGVTEDIFGDGQVRELSDALDGAGGVEVGTSASVGAKKAAGDGGRADGTAGGVGTTGGGEVGTGGPGVGSGAPARKSAANLGSVEAYSGEGADAARSALKKYAGRVKACYDQRLKENPNLAGRLVLEIDVQGGRVTTARVDENGTGDAELASCITKSARTWSLPAEISDTFMLPFSLGTN